MRLLIVAVLILNSAFGFGQTAEFFCPKYNFKFPKTNEGAQITHTYVIVNPGTAPLIISGYEVSCSCTKVILPPPIPPGAEDEITVTFDTNGKYYQQDRMINLQTNTKKKIERLRFRVFVIPDETN